MPTKVSWRGAGDEAGAGVGVGVGAVLSEAVCPTQSRGEETIFEHHYSREGGLFVEAQERRGEISPCPA